MAAPVAPNRPAQRPAMPPKPIAPPQAGKAQVPAAAAPVAAAPPAAAAAPPVAAPAPVPTADVAAAEAAGKRGRKPSEKVTYPGLYQRDEAGNVVMVITEKDGVKTEAPAYVKLAAIPTDFDAKAHAKLNASDFTEEAIYCDYRAWDLTRQANIFERKAKKLRACGNAEQQKQLSKLEKMRKLAAELEKQLRAQNVPVDDALMDPEELPEATNEVAA